MYNCNFCSVNFAKSLWKYKLKEEWNSIALMETTTMSVAWYFIYIRYFSDWQEHFNRKSLKPNSRIEWKNEGGGSKISSTSCSFRTTGKRNRVPLCRNTVYFKIHKWLSDWLMSLMKLSAKRSRLVSVCLFCRWSV